jgi:hypothetical protein
MCLAISDFVVAEEAAGKGLRLGRVPEGHTAGAEEAAGKGLRLGAYSRKIIPQRLKPSVFADLIGTAKAVPFQDGDYL